MSSALIPADRALILAGGSGAAVVPRLTATDRKFVATVLSDGGNAPVVNASDTDCWNYRDALTRNGVTIHFVCLELMTHV